MAEMKGRLDTGKWPSAWCAGWADRERLVADMGDLSCRLIEEIRRDDDTPMSSKEEVLDEGTNDGSEESCTEVAARRRSRDSKTEDSDMDIQM